MCQLCLLYLAIGLVLGKLLCYIINRCYKTLTRSIKMNKQTLQILAVSLLLSLSVASVASGSLLSKADALQVIVSFKAVK